MKKSVLIGILMLFTMPSWAQLYLNGEAHYKARVNGWTGADGNDCGGSKRGGLQWITAIFDDGSHYTFVRGSSDYPDYGRGIRSENFDNSMVFYEHNKIQYIRVHTTRRHKNGLGDCRSSEKSFANKRLNGRTCITEEYFEFKNQNNEGGALNQTGHFYLNIYPELTLRLANQDLIDLGSETELIVAPIEGIHPSYFNWEYKTAQSDWQLLPAAYQKKNHLNIKGKEFLGPESFGQMVQLRVNMGCGNPSNVVAFQYMESAPQIRREGTSINTTCYDTADGQYRMYFDRALDASEDEHININVFDTNTQSPVATYDGIRQLEDDYSYTLTGLPIGQYQIKITGKKNNKVTYSETQTNPAAFSIARFYPVDFTIGKTDVWCYQGTDGQIHLTASGGTGEGYAYQLNEGPWVDFASPQVTTHTIENLTEGIYRLNVRDSHGCEAKIQQTDSNGDIVLQGVKVLEITLNAPQTPLTIEYTLIYEPRFYGATNGRLVAKVDGGTIKDNQTYDFTWVNTAGVQVGRLSTEYVAGSYYITLDGIGADHYYLTVQDKNYTAARDKVNCTVIRSVVDLPQPEPLQARIEVIKPISCHVDNEFGDETDVNPQDGQRDESQDGHLQIIATGGRPFTGSANQGRPYKYTWKRKGANQTWQVYDEASDQLDLLADGTYAINIEDSYGIVLGVYQNNVLITPTDVVYQLEQPSELKLHFTGTDATCHGADGSIQARVEGGTPPYTYQWSNGATTATLDHLEAMPYFVTVNDARGCLVQGSFTVSQPDDVVLTEQITPLLCYNATDASIEVFVTGGTLPYQYVWNNGATTAKIDQLGWGTYQVRVTDGQGCSFVKTYTIENPAEIRLNLAQQRTLCNDQMLDLDITLKDDPGATYLWTSTNGLNSVAPQVTLTRAGVYTATVTTSNGCIVTDQIEIKRATADIDASFYLSSQAYTEEEVIIVNVSNPIGQTTTWDIPDEVEIVQETKEYVTLRFATAGTYPIQLLQTQGECFKVYQKDIIVEQNTGLTNKNNENQSTVVEEFIVSPNPNDGVFEVLVQLSKASPISLRMFNTIGQKVTPDQTRSSERIHRVDYTARLAAGGYILVLETPYQTLSKRIIIR